MTKNNGIDTRPRPEADGAASDETAGIRRQMIENNQPQADLSADEGQTWTTGQLSRDFEVLGVAAPFVVVRRRSDGQLGSLEFTHSPRVYFGWRADR
jgi:hypothetical protein